MLIYIIPNRAAHSLLLQVACAVTRILSADGVSGDFSVRKKYVKRKPYVQAIHLIGAG